jgi:frataxin-like iron-binding protein CyaY
MQKLSTKPGFSVNLEILAAAMKDDSQFRHRAEEAMHGLYRRVSSAGDDFGFDVAFDSGVLTIRFEGERAAVVVSPQPAVQQIRITAGARQYKLGWDIVENAFTLDSTGQTLQDLIEETISQFVGDDVSL